MVVKKEISCFPLYLLTTIIFAYHNCSYKFQKLVWDFGLKLFIFFYFFCCSCGTCGYELNLNSDNRNIPAVSSNYHKLIRRGTISFFCIDESRFKQTEKRECKPYFTSKKSWGLFRRRTKLLCRRCGNHIGNSYRVTASSTSLTLGKLYSITWDGMSDCRIYDIKISALQPLVSEKLSVLE